MLLYLSPSSKWNVSTRLYISNNLLSPCNFTLSKNDNKMVLLWRVENSTATSLLLVFDGFFFVWRISLFSVFESYVGPDMSTEEKACMLVLYLSNNALSYFFKTFREGWWDFRSWEQFQDCRESSKSSVCSHNVFFWDDTRLATAERLNYDDLLGSLQDM